MRLPLDYRSPPVEFEDLAHLTFQGLAQVPGIRKARGRQLDIKGVLGLIVVGLESGHHSFAAIAAFGGRRGDDLSIAMHLLRTRSPHRPDATPPTERAAIMNPSTHTPAKLLTRAS